VEVFGKGVTVETGNRRIPCNRTLGITERNRSLAPSVSVVATFFIPEFWFERNDLTDFPRPL